MFRPGVGVVAEAAAALRWTGEPVRVRFGGEDAWAIASLTSAGAKGERRAWGELSVSAGAVEISGVIVAGSAGSSVTARASVFAGYSPRAVLVPDGPGAFEVQIAAAMLGQGVVIAYDSGVRLLSAAEAAQPGTTGAAEKARGRLANRVYEGLVAAGPSPVS